MASSSDSNASLLAYTSDKKRKWVDRVDTPALNLLPARSTPSIPTSHTPHKHNILPHCHDLLPPPQPSSLPYSTDSETDTDSISSLALDPRGNTKVDLEVTLASTFASSSRFYTPSTVLDTRTPTYTPYDTPVIASTTTLPSNSYPLLQTLAQGRLSSVHNESDLLKVALKNATNAQRDVDEAAKAQVQIQSYSRPPNSQTEQNTLAELEQGLERHVGVRTAVDNVARAQQRAEESHEQLRTQSQRYVVPQLRNQSHSQPQPRPQHPHQIHIGSQAVHIYANPHPSAPSLAFPHSRPFSHSSYAPSLDADAFDWRPARRPTDQYFMERRSREKARKKKNCKYTAIAVSVFLALLVVLTVVLVLVFKHRKEKEGKGKSGGPWSNRITYWQEGRG